MTGQKIRHSVLYQRLVYSGHGASCGVVPSFVDGKWYITRADLSVLAAHLKGDI